MLYGVSLGPGDFELLTLKAYKVLREVEEVIVPGELAYEIVKKIREPRLVKIPMGRAEEVIEELSSELAEKCVEKDVAFAALGDVAFFSTFQKIAEKVVEKNESVKIELIPGVPSFTSVFSKLKLFVNAPILITTPEFEDVKFKVVLKAKNPKKISEALEEEGFEVVQAEKIFMDGEKICEPEEKASYFTMVVAWKEKSTS
ncbi:Uroporphyrin-III C/tetrapyrrole (Corrin/Porphyrin) methyltransferase [Ferroglobus placidus DSM 10642]|uniref:Uroporphyrin-III C/tetrapyrrole (Corrin/Porphyrin) methyltransferase n=1 Tax=Ferroglobus placidus (strain DSM 10642 / AEDII12DO) TaxID=589924 RepID=D3S1D4_FERPA|nr:SAM-dependent methyltransferase [Ferroglobus placidus]ADC66398.1 Uroporphyrin-III C/tetrapyrrole (Corrin/Porphyrin) methyltransferase [Ferroglobus placidus DSM 10642]